MKRSSSRRMAAALLALTVAAACSVATREPVPVQPSTPDAAGASPAGQPSAATARPQYTQADVRFLQHMIPHHEQALVMTRMVPTRSQREDIRLLAERIEVSQLDEIAQMRRWLERRGEQVPAAEAHGARDHAGHHAQMPGMLSEQELARLAAASGAEFDRLFLEYMIRHHEGALVMVAELFAAPGAGQETEIFRIASEVEADQRMEIERMRRLQNAPPAGGDSP